MTKRVSEGGAEVLVCGGGLAGTMAAVAAARRGSRVMLVERYGFLGGNATAGAVAQFNSWQTAAGRRVIAGLAQEVVDRLRRYDGAGPLDVFTMSTGHRMDRVSYSPEVLKLVLDDLVVASGVQVLFHAQVLEVQRIGARIDAVRLFTKGGVHEVRPRLLVDASGDLDAMQRAGARFLALDPGEQLQPATMMFRFGPVDHPAFEALPKAELNRLARAGYESGRLPRIALHASRDPASGDLWFNVGRLAIDATDPFALSEAEIEGRRQAWQAAAFIREQVPGCSTGRLQGFGTQVGIRETRRIAGDHLLRAEELLAGTVFEDAIACGAYPIDIHPAQGGSIDFRTMGEDHAYQIPLRSLIPVGLDNALVAGRGISATHEALAAIRVMSISMAVGEAVGTAAHLAASEADGLTRRIESRRLRALLLEQGAIVG
jgi:hypothetical protein